MVIEIDIVPVSVDCKGFEIGLRCRSASVILLALCHDEK